MLFEIGIILNPKNAKPYLIIWDRNEEWVYITNPDEKEKEHPLGLGYFDEEPKYELSSIKDHYSCTRVHTPTGVIVPGEGLGTVLYYGLLLTAGSFNNLEFAKEAGGTSYRNSDNCIYSLKSNRTSDASRWWEIQNKHDLVTSTPHCEFRYIPIPEENASPQDLNKIKDDYFFNKIKKFSKPQTKHLFKKEHQNAEVVDAVVRLEICAPENIQILKISDILNQNVVLWAPHLRAFKKRYKPTKAILRTINTWDVSPHYLKLLELPEELDRTAQKTEILDALDNTMEVTLAPKQQVKTFAVELTRAVREHKKSYVKENFTKDKDLKDLYDNFKDIFRVVPGLIRSDIRLKKYIKQGLDSSSFRVWACYTLSQYLELLFEEVDPRLLMDTITSIIVYFFNKHILKTVIDRNWE